MLPSATVEAVILPPPRAGDPTHQSMPSTPNASRSTRSVELALVIIMLVILLFVNVAAGSGSQNGVWSLGLSTGASSPSASNCLSRLRWRVGREGLTGEVGRQGWPARMDGEGWTARLDGEAAITVPSPWPAGMRPGLTPVLASAVEHVAPTAVLGGARGGGGIPMGNLE